MFTTDEGGGGFNKLVDKMVSYQRATFCVELRANVIPFSKKIASFRVDWSVLCCFYKKNSNTPVPIGQFLHPF